MSYQVKHTLDDGIERISYYPDAPRFKTPLVFQHGAWHGAWCWSYWQALFAEWGWESHAHSLPAHGQSARKRPIQLSTMGFYTAHLKAEVERMTTPPVVIGHSMGGMITQWYLKHYGDLPAAVLLASIPLYEYPFRYIRNYPLQMLQAALTLSTKPLIKTPEAAAKLFISDGAVLSAQALHAQLCDEALLVVMQLNPLLWHPRKDVRTPLMVMAGERDGLFGVEEERALAAFYGAEFRLAVGSAHNVMLERNHAAEAYAIHEWLIGQGIG